MSFVTVHVLSTSTIVSCLFVYVCMCVCMYVYIYVCVYVCMYATDGDVMRLCLRATMSARGPV